MTENDVQNETAPDTEEHVLRTKAPLWMLAVVTGVFGLIYAYSVWSAVASLIAQLNGSFTLNGLGWTIMILPIAVPVVVFGAAVAFGVRRHIGEYCLILLAGWALVQVFWMNTLALLATAGQSFLNFG